MLIAKDIFALDLGSTKFTLAALQRAGTTAGTAAVVSVPARGMRRGMLSSFDAAAEALNMLLQLGESQFNCDIERVIVSIAGTHMQAQLQVGAAPLTGGAIQPKTLKTFCEKAEADFRTRTLPGRELLHAIAVHFSVDDRPPLENPIGFSGRELRGQFLVIDADQSYLKDLVKLCNRCGLEVAGFVATPLAVAAASVSEEAKQNGVAVIDIGGGLGSGAVFQGGKVVEIFTVNVAGQLMTNDLSIGLNLPADEAERLKICFGLSSRPLSDAMEVRTATGQAIKLTVKDVYPILAARVDEFASLLRKPLQAYQGRLSHGLVVTGGGADLGGMEAFLEKRLGMPVHRASPALTLRSGDAAVNLSPSVQGGQFATALGLLQLELSKQVEDLTLRHRSWPLRYFSHLVTWIKELS